MGAGSLSVCRWCPGLSGRVSEFKYISNKQTREVGSIWRVYEDGGGGRRRIEMLGSVKVLVEFQGQKRHRCRPVLVLRKMGSRGPRTQTL